MGSEGLKAGTRPQKRCIAIVASGDTAAKTGADNEEAAHYSGKVFILAVTIGGAQYTIVMIAENEEMERGNEAPFGKRVREGVDNERVATFPFIFEIAGYVDKK